jgi:hypothetical protein
MSNPNDDFSNDGPFDVSDPEFSCASGICFADDGSLERIDDKTPIPANNTDEVQSRNAITILQIHKAMMNHQFH